MSYDLHSAQRRSSRGHVQDTNEKLADSHLLFGFATQEAELPDAFRAAADCIVALDDVDTASVQVAFRAILEMDAPAEVIATASTLPDGLLSAVVKRGSRLRDIRHYVRAKPSFVVSPSRVENIVMSPAYRTALPLTSVAGNSAWMTRRPRR